MFRENQAGIVRELRIGIFHAQRQNQYPLQCAARLVPGGFIFSDPRISIRLSHKDWPSLRIRGAWSAPSPSGRGRWPTHGNDAPRPLYSRSYRTRREHDDPRELRAQARVLKMLNPTDAVELADEVAGNVPQEHHLFGRNGRKAGSRLFSRVRPDANPGILPTQPP